jgi:maleylpyruvate isomerase
MDAAARAAEALRDLNAATGVLAAAIGGLTDAAVRAPSLLPGWTRGHVLTHLARNAEGSTRLLGWARTGVPSYEYESMQARAAAIEAGAGRPAAAAIADVRQAAAALGAAAAGMPAGAWQRVVRYTGGQERTSSSDPGWLRCISIMWILTSATSRMTGRPGSSATCSAGSSRA